MRFGAILTKEGGATLAHFPDCPGCATQADPGEDIAVQAEEALVGWLSVALEGRTPLPVPRKRFPAGAKVLWIELPPKLAVQIALKRARADAGISQTELARRAGVSQPAIAQLENPDSNPTIETLQKVAKALGARLEVTLERGTARFPVRS
ncbi:MAG: type II toxin-antitoxin system HicB family antitoxin [Myxococcota bacterium]|nr:type II toxin-antitoxin system HicB family antitoxin [Myxococcota bacterium]